MNGSYENAYKIILGNLKKEETASETQPYMGG
jgi:hypothetical protein